MKKIKRKKYLVGFLVLIALVILGIIYFYNPVVSESIDGYDVEVIMENLEIPWAVDFFPNGEMIFTERGGRVSVYDFDRNQARVIAELENVYHSGEGGLHGVTVDPNFENNNYIYFYYTHSEGNRVSRFEFDSFSLLNEEIILDGIPRDRFHNGGRIKFGPDDFLYITTGDALETGFAQDTNSLAGKILRINKDGTIPEDNPFGNEVYSYGHRNPQGIAWHPETADLYSSEHGPSGRDRINLIQSGNNYGWPNTCDDLEENQEPAIVCYTEFTLAPSGIDFYHDDLYVASLRGTQVRRITFSDDGRAVLDEAELFSDFGRIREVVSHEDWLYIATNNKDGRGIPRQGDDKIIRVRKS